MISFFKKLLICIAILFAIIALTGIDAFVVEPNILLTSAKKLEIPNWDNDLNGFKIALVTDIHLGSKFVDLNKLNHIVKIINSKNPDLIIIGGDLDSKTIAAKYSTEEVANSLKKLTAKHGVIAVMGNHDYEPVNIVKDIYKKADIKLLENQEYFIHTANNKTIKIFGFKDLWHYKTVPAAVLGTKNQMPTIVIAHNPDSFPEIPDYVSLTLSGHTHGGEIVLPFAGSFVVPSKFGQRYRNGYIIENNKHLFVSRGVATLGIARFFAPTEINILKLYTQNSIPKDTKLITGVSTNHAPVIINKIRAFIKKFK